MPTTDENELRPCLLESHARAALKEGKKIAAIVATIERNKLSGVKQAELEIREEEESRNAAIEAQLAADAEKRAKEATKKKKVDYGTNAPSIKSIPRVEDEPEP